MRGFILGTILLLFSATPAFAQAGAVTLGFNVGTGLPVTTELKDTVDRDLALAGHATIGIARALAVRVEIGRTTFAPKQEALDVCDALDISCDLTINHFSGGLQWGGFGDRGALGMSNANVRPYGFIAIGSYGLDSQSLFDNERRMGINGGFGVNIGFNQHVGVQVDLHIHTINPHQDEARQVWMTPSGGIWVGF